MEKDDTRGFYAKMQPFVQKEAAEIAERAVEQGFAKFEFSSFQTPKHTHNGIDSLQLIDTNIIPGNRIVTVFTATRNSTGAPVTVAAPIRNVRNPKRFSFHGYANNGSSISAVTTGEVIFGKCYSGSGIPFTLDDNALPFVEAANYHYASTGGSVGSGTAPYTGYVAVAGNPVAIYNLLSYSNNTLFFEYYLEDTWLIGGTIIIE